MIGQGDMIPIKYRISIYYLTDEETTTIIEILYQYYQVLR